jgi:methylmalonyl-CoA mutase N-terminal domain/subunit
MSKEIFTDSGIGIKPVYTKEDVADNGVDKELPGQVPFTRGIQPDMYPWPVMDHAAICRLFNSRRKQ